MPLKFAEPLRPELRHLREPEVPLLPAESKLRLAAMPNTSRSICLSRDSWFSGLLCRNVISSLAALCGPPARLFVIRKSMGLRSGAVADPNVFSTAAPAAKCCCGIFLDSRCASECKLMLLLSTFSGAASMSSGSLGITPAPGSSIFG